MLVSLFAAVSTAASVSGAVLAGTGPAVSTEWGNNATTDIFAVNTSGTLWTAAIFNGGPIFNGTWNSLGGVCTASPAAVSWGSTARDDVFVRGSDSAVWWRYTTNGGSSWSAWTSLGGQLASGTGPAVASWSAGRLDVFAEGTNGALYHEWWNGKSWSAWESLGGKLTSSPAATSGFGNTTPSSSGYIYVLGRGTDGACWEKVWSGTAWSNWKSLGGQLASNTGPAAVSNNILVYVQGTDSQLWMKQYDGGSWTAWSAPGSPPEALSPASPAAVITMYMMHPMVAVSSTSGNLWYGVSNVSGKFPSSNWASVGSPP
jgi:hypothetical protein